MVLVFLSAVAIFVLAVLVIMIWGAIANLIRVSRIVWHFWVSQC